MANSLEHLHDITNSNPASTHDNNSPSPSPTRTLTASDHGNNNTAGDNIEAPEDDLSQSPPYRTPDPEKSSIIEVDPAYTSHPPSPSQSLHEINNGIHENVDSKTEEGSVVSPRLHGIVPSSSEKDIEKGVNTSSSTDGQNTQDDRIEIEEATLDKKTEETTEKEGEDEYQYPSTRVVFVPIELTGGFGKNMFSPISVEYVLSSAEDRTIISTAIPRITDQFHALNDVGWYGSAYMLTSCSFQLSFGRLYTYYSPKWVLVGAIVLFEIGSAICGAAPNSTVFIVGRAIAGMGSAGIYSGAVIIIVYTVPLRQRPVYTGALGAVFGVASVAGPLLGGAFTNDVSWRWCFYINLPIGAVTLVVLILVLKLPNPPMASASGFKQKFLQLDPLGTSCFLPGVICLLLALQWGGTTYAWGNARIITLLALFGVLMVAFAVVLVWKGEHALLPLHILKRRSIASGTLFSACTGGSMLLFIYYIPIWFQSIKGVSAVKSGIDTIPLLLGLFVASMLGGISTSIIGYYTPFMLLASAVMSAGAGLLTTFTPTTNHAKWIGYQALYGIGTGFGFQQPSVAAQTVLSKEDVPTGSSLVMFAQSLGGAISVSIGGNVYTNIVVSSLVGIPNLDPNTVVNSGTTELRHLVPVQYLGMVKDAYNDGLTAAFKVGLAFSCVSLLGAVCMEWVSVKRKPDSVQEVGSN
ncbi:hypothetical protein ACLMJK_002848 [Lecanora helva]